MRTITVPDHQVRMTVAHLREQYPNAYITARPSALLGQYIIVCYPEG